eukprot:CAMPEP_0167825440 /NCGR_PEP_ID=MMETSP0112_2-20121227/9371_1 /TAXON_ID=91324 /ORGANISM="Lotharella globosa, Strain CCCM811" /LENGTH=127 /DNA_ID=CAMNT_0007727555 /DNA_START=715 /DNA_END=1096 /DNA_ORIENTATION=-
MKAIIHPCFLLNPPPQGADLLISPHLVQRHRPIPNPRHKNLNPMGEISSSTSRAGGRHGKALLPLPAFLTSESAASSSIPNPRHKNLNPMGEISSSTSRAGGRHGKALLPLPAFLTSESAASSSHSQ